LRKLRSRRRRELRFESLELRELLSVSSVLAEFSGYASTLGETAIHFELKDNASANASQIEITLNSMQAAFDPSAIRLQTAGGAQINLTNAFNTTTQSGATATISQGKYVIYFKADAGAGNFNLKIASVENTPPPKPTALNIIVEAAKSQQLYGWESRRELFNKTLYEVAPEYGTTAFNGGKIIDIFPEADVNKDGKLDNNDVQLAAQIINNNAVESKPEIITPKPQDVVNPDVTPPTITLTTQPTGITTNPTISGKIIDQSGIKSATYKINYNNEQQIQLANNGSFSILNNTLPEGKYTVTIIVTDNYGNTTTTTIPEFTYQKQIITPPPTTINDNGNGVANIDQNFTITQINNTNIANNNQITLADNKGRIEINGNTIKIIAGTSFDYLAQDEKTSHEINIQLKDIYGKTYNSKIQFTIIGKNDPPILNDNEIITQNIDEKNSGEITVESILAKWTDVDQNTTLQITDATVESITYSNDNLESIFTDNFLKNLFNVDQNGKLTFDATDESFAQLAENETIAITIKYTVTDGAAKNNGTAKFIITGKQSEIKFETENNTTELNAGYTNDRNTQKQVDFKFSYENPDAKNAQYEYSYSDIKVNGSSEVDDNLISNFDKETGAFTIDTSKLPDREVDSEISITINIVSGGSIIISKNLTVKLTALDKPTATELKLDIDENANETSATISNTTTSGNDGVEFGTPVIADENVIDLSQYGINDLSEIATLDENGNFKFDPQGYFISLAANESITLKLKYNITDKQHGNTGNGYISITIKGKATLPQNAGEQLTIDNSENSDYDPSDAIIIGKDSILEKWELPEAKENFEIVDFDNISYVNGFDGTNDFITNPFENETIGEVTTDENGNIIFTPNENIVNQLGAGQWIEIEIKYSLQNIHDESNSISGGSIKIKISGKNETPTFIEPQEPLAVNDNATLEINWKTLFNDVDLNDTLTLVQINDIDFENEITITNVGRFYFESGSLKFLPDAKFASLQKNVTEKLTITFTVADSLDQTATGNFEITITGTNKTPTAETQTKTITNGESVTFELGEITDQNTDDEHKIDKIEIDVAGETITLTKDDTTKTLDNGITVTFNAENNTVTIDTSARNKLPEDGKPETIELNVTISDDFGATDTTTWTTTITNKAPEINGDLEYKYINKPNDTTEYEINLTGNITDTNTPNRTDPIWYEISELTIIETEINEILKTELKNSLELTTNGILKFKPSDELLTYLADNLNAGKTLEIKLSYLVTDKLLKDSEGNFLSTTGELTLQIYGKKEAEIDVEDLNVDLNEDEPTNQTEITISDPDELTDNNKAEYKTEIKYDSVEIEGEQAEAFKALDFKEIFKIENGNIKFIGEADTFESLNKDEELSFTFDIVVTDQYGTTATESITITVTGKGDPATVASTDELTIWGNKRNNNSESRDVTYTITDPDVDEEHEFSFGGLLNSEGNEIELSDDVISVNKTNGQITFDNSFFESEFIQQLTDNSVFKIKIIVTGKTDKLETPLELTLNINYAKAPTIDENEIAEQEISANDKIDNIPIEIKDNSDNAPDRDNNNYEYTDLELKLDDSVVISDEIKNQIIANVTIDESGKFSFDPKGLFDYLGAGESIELTFNFKVNDKTYNVSSDGSIIVTINGVNESPVFNPDAPDHNAGNVTLDENDEGKKIELGELFSDVDQNDKHKIVSINDVTLSKEWTTVDGLGQFKYIKADDDGYGGELWYRAFVPEGVENELEKLSVTNTTLEFTIKIKDKSEAEESGTLKISVNGINSQPVIDKNPITDVIEENSISNKYSAADFVTDKNTNDEFTFATINGKEILEPSEDETQTQTIELADGTKIIVAADRKSFKIDATSRNENLEPDKIVLNSILITIADNSNTENDTSKPNAIQFKIKGVNDKPQMNNQHFGINPDDLQTEPNIDGKKYIGFIPITDIDTDTTEYTYTIENENEYPFIVVNKNNGAELYIDADKIPTLEDGGSVDYEFNVIATTQDGETITAQITVTFNHNEKPKITFDENSENLTITETENETESETVETEVTVTSENGEEVTDYSYTNIRFVEGTLTNTNNQKESIFVLPQGVEFGFEDDKFYLRTNGKFDFLGIDESAELTFEFTVFDNTNNIGETKQITVKINGANSTPVANNIKAAIDIPVDENAEYKFNIKDLFTDSDRNDGFTKIYINKQNWDFNGDTPFNLEYGTLTYEKTSNGKYIIFKPNPNSPIRANETYLLKFTFGVMDRFDARSNDGEITIGLVGINQTPKFKENVTLTADEKTEQTINAADLATDINGDPLKIIAVKVEGQEQEIKFDSDNKTITLDSGATLTLTESGQLIYNPKTRKDNLSKGNFANEKFSVKIADEFNNGSSETDWKEFTIKVTGVNDEPVNTNSETEINGNFNGEEVKIKLSEYFSDPDKDKLSYEITSQLEENPFVESWNINDQDGESYLVIKFKPNIYSDGGKFDPVDLNLKITDTNGGKIEKTFTIKFPQTVNLDIDVVKEVDGEEDTYAVTVTAKDLINELLGYNYSTGFTSIKFSINITHELYEKIEGIESIESIGSTTKASSATTNHVYAILVEITADDIAKMLEDPEFDPFNFEVISFKVKISGSAVTESDFSIGSNIEIYRTNDNVIEESQVK
jgi:VCBS repeat-containing protein